LPKETKKDKAPCLREKFKAKEEYRWQAGWETNKSLRLRGKKKRKKEFARLSQRRGEGVLQGSKGRLTI